MQSSGGSSTSQCSQDEEVDFEPAFLFCKPMDKDMQEGNSADILESVWFELKPPKRSPCMYQPFVSARQIEIVRTVLMGKNLPIKIEIPKFPGMPNPPAKTDKKLSSVRNLKKDRTDSSD